MLKTFTIFKSSFILLLVFLCIQLMGQGQSVDENNFETNWNITLQIGSNSLIGEVNSDFGGSSNEMNNLTDWGFNLQLAKMILNGLDLGVGFGFSNFKGSNSNPSNINLLMLHNNFNNDVSVFQPYPIYYDSDLTNFSFFAKYNFINFSTWSTGIIKMNIYLKMEVGIAFPSAELGYKDLSNYEFSNLTPPLFLKGRYPNLNKDSHTYYCPALGLNYQLNDRIFLSAETSLQIIGADYLDGINNYNNKLTPAIQDNQTEEFRISVFGMAARFLFGLTYFFNFDTHQQIRQKYLPWYSNRFQSYYSKFQTSTSKKERQEHLPFFKENFDNEK